MVRIFSELIDKMPAPARENARVRTRTMAAELTFIELCKTVDVSREDLAMALDVDQTNLPMAEHREDILIGTLAAYVQAMGGNLEIIAHFPDRADGKQTTIRLMPFAVRATHERFD